MTALLRDIAAEVAQPPQRIDGTLAARLAAHFRTTPVSSKPSLGNIADVLLTQVGIDAAMSKKDASRINNGIRVVVVTTQEQLMHAFYVRSINFMEGEKLKLHQAFDGNDFQATHMVAYDGAEPIGCTRIRWFQGFAKIERTTFRPDYRDPRLLKRLAEAVFEHVALKGYSKLITHAAPQFVPVWRRFLGFRLVEKEPLVGTEYPDCVEMVRDLDPHQGALTIDSDIRRLLRIEGQWDNPTWLG